MSLAFFRGRHRHDIVLPHEVEKLTWHFLEGLLGKLGRVVLEVSEGHKLDDIGLHVLFVSHRVERNFVGIQDIHALKIIAAYANNDDAERQSASTNNLVNCLLHIVDDSIGDNEQNLILLVHLRDILGLGHIIYELNNWCEISRTVQIDVFKRVFVSFNDTFEAVDFRVENVPIKGKAVRSSVCRWRDCCAKAERWNLLV